MAHYAKVNGGIVEQVIVAEAEFFDTFVDSSPGQWIQTSYNTQTMLALEWYTMQHGMLSMHLNRMQAGF